MSYMEAAAKGAEHRELEHIRIDAGRLTDGTKGWVVSKMFESRHHSPEESFFALDEGHELLQYVADCLEIDENGRHPRAYDEEEKPGAEEEGSENDDATGSY